MSRHLLAALAALMLATPAAGAAGIDRLYLLAAPGGAAYFSPDPDDPEAPAGTLDVPCRTQELQGRRLCLAAFHPAVALDEPIRWSAAAPLRFHAELSRQAVGDSEVSFYVQINGRQFDTPPATEVAPGVWEATLGSPGGATSLKYVPVLGVRLVGPGASGLAVRTRGRSWVDLPAPVSGRSVPELLAADPPAAAPTAFTTPHRRFTFADGDWEDWSFEGDTAQTRSFDVEVPRLATAVYAWLEHADGPLLHQAARGEQPEPRWVTDVPNVVMERNGQRIGDGGTQARAVQGLSAGSLQLRVFRGPQSLGKPYVLRVLAVYGERTLKTMRWRATMATSVHATAFTQCPLLSDPVVVPAAATTFSVGVTWSSPNPFTRWGLFFGVPSVGEVPCGSERADPYARFVLPRVTAIHKFGPRIVTSRGPVAASVYDTVFELEARLAY